MKPFRHPWGVAQSPLAFLPVLFAAQAVYFDLEIFRLLTMDLSAGVPPDFAPDRMVIALVLGLVVSAAAWAFLVSRWKVPSSTGAGFVVASTGLLITVLANTAVRLGDGRTETTGGLVTWPWATASGIAVYAIGLTFVAVACIAERRALRRLRSG